MILVRNIKVPVLNYNDEEIVKKIKHKLKVKNIDNFKILKKSIDARDKNNILYVLEVIVKTNRKVKFNKDVLEFIEKKYEIPKALNPSKKVVIVGAGPAGLFASYILVLAGFKPIILERGKKIEERIKDVNEFWNKNVLNEESNVLYGEGGAGTFSDGKLNTGLNDKTGIHKFVLETFVKFGAPEDILILSKPHIGTDNLRKCITNMRIFIEKMGGEFKFNTKLTNINVDNQKIKSIIVNKKEELPCDNLILAIGHSARDTFKMLNKVGLEMESKPFAVGVRVIHKRDLIDEAMYGKFTDYLPTASYKLTYQAKDKRGVYSFCMCPGGYVVNSSNKNGELVINGMSNYKRDSDSSNSAIVVTVSSKDFGNSLFDGMNFQESLERKAFQIGKGVIPYMCYQDYVNNRLTKRSNPKDVCGKTLSANINLIFPEYINKDIKEGLEYFGTKIKGFNDPETIILGVESRTSSPIRIKRSDNFESNIKGIYPSGEGAGYAGGIITAAVDAIKIAEVVVKC